MSQKFGSNTCLVGSDKLENKVVSGTTIAPKDNAVLHQRSIPNKGQFGNDAGGFLWRKASKLMQESFFEAGEFAVFVTAGFSQEAQTNVDLSQLCLLQRRLFP